jgi:hypothetical protein
LLGILVSNDSTIEPVTALKDRRGLRGYLKLNHGSMVNLSHEIPNFDEWDYCEYGAGRPHRKE